MSAVEDEGERRSLVAMCAMHVYGALPSISIADADKIAEALVAEGWTLLRAPCDHKQWSFKTHGRVCPCGVYMQDFGD